jgi:RNA polymerase sigma factor (sigma-70 family)
MHEDQLIQACLHGDRAAQRALVREYGPRLMTVCRLYTPPRLDPEDTLQDVFIQVFSYLHQFNGHRGALWSWMKTIAIREALKKNRLTQKWHLQSHSFEEYMPEPQAAEVLSELQAEEILKLVSRLPDGFREVFTLVAIEGYTHDECAGMLGIASGTSRACLNRARQLLQTQILNLTTQSS